MSQRAHNRCTPEFKEQALGLLSLGKPVADRAQEPQLSSNLLGAVKSVSTSQLLSQRLDQWFSIGTFQPLDGLFQAPVQHRTHALGRSHFCRVTSLHIVDAELNFPAQLLHLQLPLLLLPRQGGQGRAIHLTGIIEPPPLHLRLHKGAQAGEGRFTF